MNKELEALIRLYKHIDADDLLGDDYYINDNASKDFDIVETALKRLDMHEKVVGIERIQDTNKKLKALEIIKKRFTIQFLKSDLPNYYGIMQIGANPIYIKTKEKFYLLKEVLL